MQADWEVEIGPDAPVIEGQWPGLVDLQRHPQLLDTLPETALLPGLADGLRRLNQPEVPLWTAKCDAWPILDTAGIDPYELDASPEGARDAWACYIDLLPKDDEQWTTHAMAVLWCKAACARLHERPLSGCRVDLVMRRAAIAHSPANIAITAYLTACGKTPESANSLLGIAIRELVDALGQLQR